MVKASQKFIFSTAKAIDHLNTEHVRFSSRYFKKIQTVHRGCHLKTKQVEIWSVIHWSGFRTAPVKGQAI